MVVGISVGSVTDEIGESGFVHISYSTISDHFKLDGWGTKCPQYMNDLCQGYLLHSLEYLAFSEHRDAKSVLEKPPPSQLVRDINNREVPPPRGTMISPNITSIGNHFVSNTGRAVFALPKETLQESVAELKDTKLG